MTSPKVILIQEMHNIFIGSDDMLEVQQRIEQLLSSRKLKFKEPKEIDTIFFLANTGDMATCFFNALYADRNANDIGFFAVKCEVYIDFNPITPAYVPPAKVDKTKNIYTDLYEIARTMCFPQPIKCA